MPVPLLLERGEGELLLGLRLLGDVSVLFLLSASPGGAKGVNKDCDRVLLRTLATLNFGEAQGADSSLLLLDRMGLLCPDATRVGLDDEREGDCCAALGTIIPFIDLKLKLRSILRVGAGASVSAKIVNITIPKM